MPSDAVGMDCRTLLRPRLWVAVCGVAGMIGLLLAANAAPAVATALRVAALLSFLGLGAYETIRRNRQRDLIQ